MLSAAYKGSQAHASPTASPKSNSITFIGVASGHTLERYHSPPQWANRLWELSQRCVTSAIPPCAWVLTYGATVLPKANERKQLGKSLESPRDHKTTDANDDEGDRHPPGPTSTPTQRNEPTKDPAQRRARPPPTRALFRPHQ
jgi:hypothetical protein